ncbi:MAG: hypothetical protein ACTSWY_07960, partial [Promethearchaeota archaeon]
AKITLDGKNIFWKRIIPRGLFESGKVNQKTGKHYLINSDCNGAGNIIRLAWLIGHKIEQSDITPLNIDDESDLEKLNIKKINGSKSTIINKKLFKAFGQMDGEPVTQPFTQMNNQQINKLLQRPQIIKIC